MNNMISILLQVQPNSHNEYKVSFGWLISCTLEGLAPLSADFDAKFHIFTLRLIRNLCKL